MKNGKLRALAIVCGAFAVVSAACGDADGSGGNRGGDGLTGDVVISGSSTVEPISSIVAELFNEENPDVDISVDGPGTGDGFELFCNGETDISDASRPIKEEEAEACADNGVEYVELEVALDGITVMTGLENDAVDCLTNADLYALVGPESEGFDTWADANDLAAEVGGRGGLPNVPLDITAPGEESGTYDAFIELALADVAEARLEAGEITEDQAVTTRADYQSSPNDNVIIQGIQGSDSSFGWVGFAFFEENAEAVKAIEIDGGGGCVAPDRETIADGTYPISRSLFIYVNTGNLRGNEALRAYVDFYMGDGGLVTSVDESGYVALPDDRLEATRKAWEDATA